MITWFRVPFGFKQIGYILSIYLIFVKKIGRCRNVVLVIVWGWSKGKERALFALYIEGLCECEFWGGML